MQFNLGIGAMTHDRIKSFFEKMVAAKIFSARSRLSPGLYTAVCEYKGVGKELRRP
jgi:hypothetical protein